MSTRRSLARTLLSLAGTALVTSLVVACSGGVPAGDAVATQSTGEALTLCPRGYEHTCTNEGPNGSLVCTPCTPIPYWEDNQSANTCNLPGGHVSSYLSSLGCSAPIIVNASNQPVFMCPISVDSQLHGISWYGLPECPVVDGHPQRIDGGNCESLGSTLNGQMVPGNYPVACDGVPNTGFEYVFVTLNGDGGGSGGCPGGCSVVWH